MYDAAEYSKYEVYICLSSDAVARIYKQRARVAATMRIAMAVGIPNTIQLCKALYEYKHVATRFEIGFTPFIRGTGYNILNFLPSFQVHGL